MIAFLQEQEQKLAGKEAEIDQLRRRVDDQEKTLDELKKTVGDLRAADKEYKNMLGNTTSRCWSTAKDTSSKMASCAARKAAAAKPGRPLSIRSPSTSEATPLDPKMPIFARVFVNVKALGTVVHNSGLVSSTGAFYKFTVEFTNYLPGFALVDVGYGDQKADAKMQHELLSLFCSEDVRCKKIFFVGCHDSGYVHDLAPFVGDEEDRLVLVEAEPARSVIRNLGLPITRFDRVFRKDPLPDNTPTVTGRDASSSDASSEG
ncbi:hypothetical protein ACJZ2D_009508 [Fusarium nematophilum]